MGNRPRNRPARGRQARVVAASLHEITAFAADDLLIPSGTTDWILRATVSPAIYETLTSPTIVVKVWDAQQNAWVPDAGFTGRLEAQPNPTTLEVYVKIGAGEYGERTLDVTTTTVTVTTRANVHFEITDT